MSKIGLLHTSYHVIEKSDFHIGKTNNDYGRGFYCTRKLPMVMEWITYKRFKDIFSRVHINLTVT